MILLPTDSNKLLMQWRGPYTVKSRVGANDYRVKMGSKTKTYHLNMLKKYISREPEGNVVPVDDTDGATVAVAGVIHQDIDPELGEVPDLEGYRQREGVRDVKLGDELPEDQRRVLKDLVRRYPDVFTDMPGETDVIQHQIRLTDDTPIRCKPYPLPYELFGRLRKARITARPTKCLLGASRMEFLGHQVRGDVITPSRDNLEKVRNTPRPTTKKQVRSFLGLVGYYRDHIPAFAEISAPLTDLLKKGKAEHIQWSEAQERAYS